MESDVCDVVILCVVWCTCVVLFVMRSKCEVGFFVFFGDVCQREVITEEGEKKRKYFPSLCYFRVVREGWYPLSRFWPSSAQSSLQSRHGVLKGGSLT